MILEGLGFIVVRGFVAALVAWIVYKFVSQVAIWLATRVFGTWITIGQSPLFDYGVSVYLDNVKCKVLEVDRRGGRIKVRKIKGGQ